MSCGTPVTRQLISYHAKQHGVEFKEASRLFHWLKNENQRTLRYSSEDAGAAIGVVEARSWLQANQRLFSDSVDADQLDGFYLQRMERISDGTGPLKLSELDALRALPGVLTVRSQVGKCLQCGQFAESASFHDCPSHDAEVRKIRWPLGIGAVHATAWWDSFPDEIRDKMIYRYPERIGAMDGLPIEARDRANRIVLDREEMRLDYILSEVSNPSSSYVLNSLSPSALLHARWVAEEQMKIVQNVKQALAFRSDLFLPVFETYPLPGRAAISVGDADKARNVAVVVPGMSNFVGKNFGDVFMDAVNLQQEAERYALFMPAEENQSTAVVSWLGYHAPDGILQAMSKKYARVGGPILREFLLGLRSTRQDQENFHLSLIGHSYGSVVSALAVHKDKDDVEDLVNNIAFIGSPGVTVRRAKRFKPYEGRIFTGAASGDPIVLIGWHGSRPASKKFGAYIMRTDGGTDPVTGKELLESIGHSAYYDEGTFSLRNLALLSLGKNDLVVMKEDRKIKKRPS